MLHQCKPPDEQNRNTEQTPLLSRQPADNAVDTVKDNVDESTLATSELLALCWARIVEQWTFCSLFPYLPAFVERTGTPEAQLGYYCGLVESSFALMQFLAMLLWSQWADSYGRKPVLCAALLGASVSAFLFGIATEIWQMVLLRGLAGIFGSSILTVRLMVSESTNSRNKAQAFSAITSAGQICMLLAPLAGGALYDPATQMPWTAIHLPVLKTYPALLPSFANGCVGMGALFAILLYAKETKPASLEGAKEPDKPSYRSVLAAPGVLPVLVMYFCNDTFFAAAAVNPVFYFTDIRLGGWSFSTYDISIFLGCLGIAGAVYSLFIFAPLSNRYGTRKMMTYGSLLQLLTYSWPILSNYLLRHGDVMAFWSLTPFFGIVQAVSRVSSVISVTLAMNSVAPPGTLGLCTGLVFSLGAAQRAIVPAAATATFAVGVEKQVLGGYLVWIILLAWAAFSNLYVGFHAECLEDKEE